MLFIYKCVFVNERHVDEPLHTATNVFWIRESLVVKLDVSES
jgi:hypothetical protein